MALPGGDPIAAALAAGETPSPEMVAASTEKEGFSSRVATICFVGILASAAALQVIPRDYLLRWARLEIPPQVLADRAQGMLRKFGHTARPGSAFYGFRILDPGVWDRVSGLEESRRRRLVAAHQPAILSFWYGESPSEIVAEAFPGGRVRYDSPAKEKPGMIRMDLDATGRLLTLEARPEQTAGPDKPATPDWNVLLDAAGLDAAHFSVATPQDVIPVMADARMASDRNVWAGPHGEGARRSRRPERTTGLLPRRRRWASTNGSRPPATASV